ncbi:hypothetical protein K2173_025744 [Erythroxylum novogranatense]|uniref:C2 and GRAM domain-containing protein n=1 Tax=Erythroxylum novogranatense TaxID=1862640 RepID=A0AAV8T2P9_9ROSI|nr:hypothetical protein K2173_025744 [Erythroxylum novogranatense]
MKLVVRVVEARNLPPMDSNGLSDPYVKLQLGRQKFKTKVVKKCLNPTWGEEFSFKVDDLHEELVISVLDEDKYFNDDFLGMIKMPVSRVFDADTKCLGTSWYSLQPRSKKSKNKDCGEILLGVCFSPKNFTDSIPNGDLASQVGKNAEKITESPRRSFNGLTRLSTPSSPSKLSRSSSPSRISRSSSPPKVDETVSAKEEKSSTQKSLAVRIAQIFNKSGETTSTTSTRSIDVSEVPQAVGAEVCEDKLEDQSSGNFEELMKAMESRNDGRETPNNLSGGVLLDQLYVIAPKDLNTLIFSPDSSLWRSVADSQGNTEQQYGPWKFENGGANLKRVITYIKAPSKLIKAVKAIEEHTYLKADGKVFSVLASVSTPDVMYGSTFRTEVLYRITPGPELQSGEETSQFVVSWRMNFLQSTMVKGMIENGARQGTKDSFEQFASVLSQNVKLADLNDMRSNKEQILASLQAERQSDWKLAMQYFANFTVISTVFIGLYVFVHIWLAAPSTIQGLEFIGLDLPDSIGEVIVCGILVLQCERVLGLLSRFMQARVQRGSDHGIKAQGDGWLLTVALIEGSNLAAVDSSGLCDPYVAFTCNGKTRTSSIKFQQFDPMWNEIFEFDAMDEPPSMLDVEVYDFDGPFSEATSLGHSEINFLKSNLSDLADVWVPLQGKLSQACQSKLHLRIFLNNTKGGSVVKDYLSKMEKEVGTKISLRSPQTNSAFQKLFGLPPEEFLINDFTCHLKRKMPLQGRLFLSARIIGFHSNIFGHKTTFFFLWEDIEDIQVYPPTLSSMGSPVIVFTLRQGRGMDARHGAKSQDDEGRLKFHFHSFVSFSVAHRTIMALWKARALTPEVVQLIEEESDSKILQTEESGSDIGLDDVSMSEVHSAYLSVPVDFVMKLFGDAELERKVMEKSGFDNYSCTPWESENDVYERQICYRFNKRVSRYGGEVTSTQQKYLLSDKKGWVVDDVATLHGVPLGDCFNIHLKFQIEDMPSKPKGCHVQVSFGLAWLKSTKHQKKITKNVLSNLQDRLKMTLSFVEREYSNR